MSLQNSDGGWPTFCRGWGKLPFDRSGSDLTAHAIRALQTHRDRFHKPRRLDLAIRRGLRFLQNEQYQPGFWIPLWFGSQDHPKEENPVYGTARVVLAYRDLGRLESPAVRRAWDWLSGAQNADGSWDGGGKMGTGSVEETALAVEALLAGSPQDSLQPAIEKGLDWLIHAVLEDRFQECSPIGFYFAKLWYYERLYPMVFTVSALGTAITAGLLDSHQLKRVRRVVEGDSTDLDGGLGFDLKWGS